MPSTGAVSGWNCFARVDVLTHAEYLAFCGPQDHHAAHEQARICDQTKIGLFWQQQPSSVRASLNTINGPAGIAGRLPAAYPESQPVPVATMVSIEEGTDIGEPAYRRHVDTAGPLQCGPGKHIRSLYPQYLELRLKAVDHSVLCSNYDLQIIRIAALMSSISMYLV